ncbi:MAG: aldo/keto reductase [Dissulfurispiraceae bacterium]
MKKLFLGHSNLEVSPVALGGNVFGWTADEPMAFKILDAFVEAGFNFIDTADSYSRWLPGNKGGESETIIGKWLKLSSKRDKVVIATKVGSEMGPNKKGLSKPYILCAAEDSLKRLQTDHIDLYQSHFDDPDTPMDETLEAYAQLVEQGKVKAIGASNFSAERLLQALQISKQLGYPSYQSLQTLYNLYDREDYESNLEHVCLDKGLGVITYFSLASGFLTGKYRSDMDLSKSARRDFAKKYLNERGLRILDALDKVARQYNATPAKVSLAWLMTRPGITAPISSVTSLGQLKELIESARLKLDDSSVKLLNDASAY